MRGAGPVAAFTGRTGPSMHQRKLRVRVIVKLLRDIGMAQGTSLRTGIVGRDGCSCLMCR